MNNEESVLEHETHKLYRHFKIQTDHQISARPANSVQKKKKKRTCRIVEFAVPVNHRVKQKESSKIIIIKKKKKL